MFKKLKSYFNSYLEERKRTNELLYKINESLEIRTDSLNSSFSSVRSNLESYITTNVYSKNETVDIIDKEHKYLKDYDECSNVNPVLLEFVETYCKYQDKYEALDLFHKLANSYTIYKIKNTDYSSYLIAFKYREYKDVVHTLKGQFIQLVDSTVYSEIRKEKL